MVFIKIISYIAFTIVFVVPNLYMIGQTKDVYDRNVNLKEISFEPNALLKSFRHHTSFEIEPVRKVMSRSSLTMEKFGCQYVSFGARI